MGLLFTHKLYGENITYTVHSIYNEKIKVEMMMIKETVWDP